MADTGKINEVEMTPSPLEQLVIKIDDMEQSMGFWYSLFALRIVPFLLYIIPVNVILGRINRVIAPYFPGVNLNGTILLVSWIVVMLGFLALTIFAPKAATVVEFVFGFAYLFLVFRFNLHHTVVGYVMLFWMILFLLIKTVFLVFKIMRLKVASGDSAGVERDESGRVVRASEEEVFFVSEDKNAEEESASAASDDEVFFVKENDDKYNEGTISESDNDYFFG